ncbi:putative Helicase(SNF2-related,6-226)1 [Magnetospirillum sp. XM-1]|nr:DEAD/DEAH box helicase [Magnetospirillum sp. XM-1]CUW38825.1 putative Helicase(SNF2-related,6-226)1 [Magnetospirillum sp. XM-1]
MDLYGYQETGVAFLSGRKGAILGDGMRLGKTPQAIRAAGNLGAERVLVVTTAKARVNWGREWMEWGNFPLPVHVIGSTTQRIPDRDVVVVSYEQVLADGVFNQLSAGRWDVLVMDESHRLKSPDAQITRKVLGKYGLIHKSGHRWALSGTPSPNHPGELWTMLYTNCPDAIRDNGKPMGQDAFERRYCNIVTDRKTGFRRVMGGKNLGELKDRLSGVMLRRTKEEVWPERPRVIWGAPLYVEPDAVSDELRALENSPEGLQLKALLSKDELPEADDAMLATLRRLTGIVKARAVAELVQDELLSGSKNKLVIYGWHRAVLEELHRRLGAYGAVMVYGGTADAQKNIDLFQTDPETRVFIGQIKSVGEAIRLDAADDVIFVEGSWTPGDNHQAADRIWHLSKQVAMSARFVALAGSVDEAVLRVLTRKCRTLSGLYD